ncbi:hypothetical protein LTR86_005887 [Recurvomyces mirabilis]|nr:hypothetical protein LTR86_005887 [Recurvomyces mirabilis]
MRFQDWLGHSLFEEKLSPFAGNVEVKQLSKTEREEWSAFNKAAQEIDDWYDEARKRTPPQALDAVCAAISSLQPSHKKTVMYGHGLGGHVFNRTSSNSQDDETFRSARFDTNDAVRRKSMSSYLLSPHSSTDRTSAARKPVLLAIQRRFNEVFRQNLRDAGLDTRHFVDQVGHDRPTLNATELARTYLVLYEPNSPRYA